MSAFYFDAVVIYSTSVFECLVLEADMLQT